MQGTEEKIRDGCREWMIIEDDGDWKGKGRRGRVKSGILFRDGLGKQPKWRSVTKIF